MLPGDRILAGLARWIGAGGLASIQLLIGFWVLHTVIAFRRGTWGRKSFLFGFLLLLLAHMMGAILLSRNTAFESISVALWQPDIPIRTKFSEEQQNRLPKKIQESLERAKALSASLLIAPEGMLSANQDLLAPAPVPFLSGGFRWVRGMQRSSLLVFDRGERAFSRAIDKYRLVPIGERVPSFFQFSTKGLSAVGGLEPGTPSRLLSWSGPSLSAAICYELSDGYAVATAVKDGAKWILAIANLDPYPLSLQRQFVSLAQLRSIENSRDLISVSNTGPTSLFLSSGEVYPVIPPFTEGIELAEVNLNREITAYTRWKEAPLIGIFLLCLFGIYFLHSW